MTKHIQPQWPAKLLLRCCHQQLTVIKQRDTCLYCLYQAHTWIGKRLKGNSTQRCTQTRKRRKCAIISISLRENVLSMFMWAVGRSFGPVREGIRRSRPPRWCQVWNWCVIKDSRKRQRHHRHMEHKDTKSCRETPGTNTRNWQVQTEHLWNLWDEMEEL